MTLEQVHRNSQVVEVAPHPTHQHSLEDLPLHLAQVHKFQALSLKESKWQALVEQISIIYQRKCKIKSMHKKNNNNNHFRNQKSQKFQLKSKFLIQLPKWKRIKSSYLLLKKTNGNGTKEEITMSSGKTSEKESHKSLRLASRQVLKQSSCLVAQ